MIPFDPHKHHRRSIRLKGYDYSQPGAYFITLVTFQRDEIFGEVVNGEVKLSALGKMVSEEWLRSMEMRKEIRLNEDEFVVMPNHLHGIVWIVGADGIRPDSNASTVGADGIRPIGVHPNAIRPNSVHMIDQEKGVNAGQGACHAPVQRAPRSLGSFIAGFKAAVSSRARRELEMEGIWQRNYFEHIIRNEREFTAIWNYIDANPLRWYEDQLHPKAPSNRFNQG